MEDIITVINGRVELAIEIRHAEPELRDYVTEELETLLGVPAFTDHIPGHLRANQNRTSIVIDRIRKITGL